MKEYQQTATDAFSGSINSACYNNGGNYDCHCNHDSTYQVLQLGDAFR